jgi:hypothetical protein
MILQVLAAASLFFLVLFYAIIIMDFYDDN